MVNFSTLTLEVACPVWCNCVARLIGTGNQRELIHKASLLLTQLDL